jgi:phosphoribosylamine---glycine ligase
MMNVLILGSGGREHALAWKVAQSPKLSKLYVAPGNPGTAAHGENVTLDISDHATVVRFCIEKQIDLVIVGPEAPLADGIADALAEAESAVLGRQKRRRKSRRRRCFPKISWRGIIFPQRGMQHSQIWRRH